MIWQAQALGTQTLFVMVGVWMFWSSNSINDELYYGLSFTVGHGCSGNRTHSDHEKVIQFSTRTIVEAQIEQPKWLKFQPEHA